MIHLSDFFSNYNPDQFCQCGKFCRAGDACMPKVGESQIPYYTVQQIGPYWQAIEVDPHNDDQITPICRLSETPCGAIGACIGRSIRNKHPVRLEEAPKRCTTTPLDWETLERNAIRDLFRAGAFTYCQNFGGHGGRGTYQPGQRYTLKHPIELAGWDAAKQIAEEQILAVVSMPQDRQSDAVTKQTALHDLISYLDKLPDQLVTDHDHQTQLRLDLQAPAQTLPLSLPTRQKAQVPA